jgi:hypothetical protein
MAAPSFGSAQDVPLLRTKLYVPPVRSELVSRLRLTERLNSGLQPHASVVAMAAFCVFFSLPITTGSSQAIWQSKLAPDVQRRVFAVRSTIALSMSTLSYILAGPLADKVFESRYCTLQKWSRCGKIALGPQADSQPEKTERPLCWSPPDSTSPRLVRSFDYSFGRLFSGLVSYLRLIERFNVRLHLAAGMMIGLVEAGVLDDLLVATSVLSFMTVPHLVWGIVLGVVAGYRMQSRE